MPNRIDLVWKLRLIVLRALGIFVELPRIPEVRVDPNGLRKRQACERNVNRSWIGLADISSEEAPLPRARNPIETIYIQWLDEDGHWHDAEIDIAIETQTIVSPVGWMNGSNRPNDGAFSFVALAALASILLPCVLSLSAYWKVRERRAGMNRFGIIFMERLEGKLDIGISKSLFRALRNDVSFGSDPR